MSEAKDIAHSGGWKMVWIPSVSMGEEEAPWRFIDQGIVLVERELQHALLPLAIAVSCDGGDLGCQGVQEGCDARGVSRGQAITKECNSLRLKDFDLLSEVCRSFGIAVKVTEEENAHV